MGTDIIASNVKAMKTNGFIRCGVCDSLLLYVDYDRLKSIYVHIGCKCGSKGYMKFKKDSFADISIAEAVVSDSGELRCPECGAKLFAVSDNVDSFSFAAECMCGKECGICRRGKNGRRLLSDIYKQDY